MEKKMQRNVETLYLKRRPLLSQSVTGLRSGGFLRTCVRFAETIKSALNEGQGASFGRLNEKKQSRLSVLVISNGTPEASNGETFFLYTWKVTVRRSFACKKKNIYDLCNYLVIHQREKIYNSVIRLSVQFLNLFFDIRTKKSEIF